MAKKALIARQTKRQKLVQKYAAKRLEFKERLRTAESIREVVHDHIGLPWLKKSKLRFMAFASNFSSRCIS